MEHGVPGLTETAPGLDVAAMLPLHTLVEPTAIIQVAEQNHYLAVLMQQAAATGEAVRWWAP